MIGLFFTYAVGILIILARSGHLENIPRTEPGEILAELPMHITATSPLGVPKTSSTSDQTGDHFDSLELDSLIGSDNAADVASLPVDECTGRALRYSCTRLNHYAEHGNRILCI